MEKNLNKKYRVPTIIVLALISCVVNFILIDLYVLPRQTVSDKIVSTYKIYHYRNSKFGRTKILYAYKFYTEKGFEITTEDELIEETAIEIEHTKILKNITRVKSIETNYLKSIISDLNGPALYFFLIVAISSITSILILIKKRNISNNEFQNIALFNLMMLLFIGMIYYYT